MSTFTLVQPRVRRREWELLRGDEVRAVLRMSTFLPRIRADVAGRPVRIEQRGWWRKEDVVCDESTDEEVARLHSDGRRRLLELAGRTLEWKRLGRKEGFGFVGESGQPLLIAKLKGGIVRFYGEVAVDSSIPEAQALLLAVLAVYLLIRRNAAAVAGATAAAGATSV